MSHLDEGTIHAWLDGALDDAQARDVESHAAGCADCAALVAEARGLIAGASRVLRALDDVPGGVLPAGSRAAPPMPAMLPAAAPVPASARPPVRRWASAPWITGIAAVLVAAVVLRTSNEVTRSESLADSSAQAAMDTVRAMISAPSPVASAPARESALEEAAPGERQGGDAATSLRRADERATAPQRAVGNIAGAAGAATRDGARDFAGAGAGAGAPPPAARTERAPEQSLAAAAAPPPAPPVPSAAAPTPQVAQKAELHDLTVTAAPAGPESALAGCYIVSFAESRVTTSTERTRAASDARGAARVGAQAPSAAPMAATADRALPADARVVSLTLVTADSARVYQVRSARGDSVVGTWRAVDSASAEVRTTAGQRLVVPRSIRTPCPQP